MPSAIQMRVTLPDGRLLTDSFAYQARSLIEQGGRGWQLRGVVSPTNQVFTTGPIKASVVCDGIEIDVTVPEIVLASASST